MKFVAIRCLATLNGLIQAKSLFWSVNPRSTRGIPMGRKGGAVA